MAWVSKNPIFFSQINLFSVCDRIEPKLNKLQKTVKIDKKSSKNPCFLVVFWSLLNFGSILAQKHTKCKYLSIVPFFCHPGHPWSCESSGVITTLISLFKIFQQQCHLVTFFKFPKWKHNWLTSWLTTSYFDGNVGTVGVKSDTVTQYYTQIWLYKKIPGPPEHML